MHGPVGDSPIQDAKREAILKHARTAFVTEGYAATRMEPIAREAGVSTATVYALFAGKAELYAAVIDEAGDDFARRMAHVRASEGDARQALTGFAEAYADFMGDVFVRSIFRLVVAERPRFQAVASHLFSKGQAAISVTLMNTLTRLAEEGQLKPLHPSWAAGQLLGMIEHPIFFVSLVTGDEIRIERTRKQIVDDAVETFLARYGA